MSRAVTPFYSSVLLLLTLVGLEAVYQVPDVRKRIEVVERLTLLLHKRGMNIEAVEANRAGYYEGLLNEGSRVSMMSAIASLAPADREVRASPFRAVRRRSRLSDRYDHTGTFLFYEPRPNVDVPDYDDERLRLVTNRHGFSDRDYTVEKPVGTRRLVLFGDSVVRGMGAPFGTSFEARLESRLNEELPAGGPQRLEILNFAVSGYRLTQALDMALTRASRFDPDLYVVALTENAGSRKWAEHLIQLVYEGIDLKYDFLKQIVAEAGLKPTDPVATAEAKLAPFRARAIRWMLDHIGREGGDTLLLLVPTVKERDLLEAEFSDIRAAVRGIEAPVVDLLDTFDGMDLARYRVSDDNFHPNEDGHAVIFEKLHARLMASPRLRESVFGAPDGAPSRAARR